MPRRISLQSHLSTDELERRYRGTKEPVERSHWHMLWLLAQGQTATQVAANTGYSAYWIGQIARRYNEQGVKGMADRRRAAPHQTPTLLSAELLAELRTGLSQPAPDAPSAAAWTSAGRCDRSRE